MKPAKVVCRAESLRTRHISGSYHRHLGGNMNDTFKTLLVIGLVIGTMGPELNERL